MINTLQNADLGDFRAGTGTVLMGSLSTRYLVRRWDKFYFRMWLPVQFARLLRIPEVEAACRAHFGALG